MAKVVSVVCTVHTVDLLKIKWLQFGFESASLLFVNTSVYLWIHLYCVPIGSFCYAPDVTSSFYHLLFITVRYTLQIGTFILMHLVTFAAYGIGL